MKNIFILISLLFVGHSYSQKYFTKTGTTEFKASVDTFEPVEAINNSTTAIVNMATGEVAALLFISAFQFDIALMQEHFNENYMFSADFPKAKFKGQLLNFKAENLSSTSQTFQLKGKITIKGISKSLQIPVQLKRLNQQLIVDADFGINPLDHDIEIPNAVEEKIAKTVKINLHYALIEKK